MNSNIWIVFISIWTVTSCQNDIWKISQDCITNATCYNASHVTDGGINPLNIKQPTRGPPKPCRLKNNQSGFCYDSVSCEGLNEAEFNTDSNECPADKICCLHPSKRSSKLPLRIDVKDTSKFIGIKPQQCITNDNKPGACVKGHMCSNGNIDTYGSFAIVPKDGGECDMNNLEKCCALPEIMEMKPGSENKAPVVPFACGIKLKDLSITARITQYADDVLLGEFPWVVRVLRNNPKKFLGGGSLIHARVVLTAAHILDNAEPEMLLIQAGYWDTGDALLEMKQDKKITKIIQHENFYPMGLLNNIALLIMDSDVNINNYVNLLCLPPVTVDAPAGNCIATGWDMPIASEDTRQLKKINLPIVERAKCESTLKNEKLGYFFKLHESFICAGGETGKDTCNGDGGSPLICTMPNNPEQYMQSGIVSWGLGCGLDGVPSVYTNVGLFRKWIDTQLSDNNIIQ